MCKISRRLDELCTPAVVDAGLHESVTQSLERLLCGQASALDRLARGSREIFDLPPRDRLENEALGADGENDDARIALRAGQWGAGLTEMFDRLEHDWAQIVERFDLDPTSRLATITPQLGDLHNSGRAVYGLRLDDGRAIIYKPRPVDVEHALGRLVDWIARDGCPLSLSACRVLPRPGYGWTQYVPYELCTTRDDAIAFYRRQGAFLAIFWLLCSDDLFDENVIVAGSHPIWVDTECTGVPELTFVANPNAALDEWIRDSVLSTGMVFYGKEEGIPPRERTGLSLACLKDRSLVFTPDNVMRPACRRAVLDGF
jgi:hypothetical protein